MKTLDLRDLFINDEFSFAKLWSRCWKDEIPDKIILTKEIYNKYVDKMNMTHQDVYDADSHFQRSHFSKPTDKVFHVPTPLKNMILEYE